MKRNTSSLAIVTTALALTIASTYGTETTSAKSIAKELQVARIVAEADMAATNF